MVSQSSTVDDDLPFSALRVIDLSQGVAGPHCGMLFAQNGADVIKVEPPDGDWGRAIGAKHEDFCAYNIAFNRGKRSLAVDLKSALGLDTTRQLLSSADVVIENYRPGVLQRFGLDYDNLKAINPHVVYVSITGFGQSGPRAKLPATDAILQSFSGLMSVNRGSDGMPHRVGVLLIDVVTGLYAFQAASTALYKRATRGGGGRHLSVSLMESIGAVQAGSMIEYHLQSIGGKPPGAPVVTFETADAHMTINLRRDVHFHRLCAMLGCDAFVEDPRFASFDSRIEHAGEWLPILREKLKTWDNAALTQALSERDILHGPVNTYSDYFDDEHVKAGGSVQWIDHPGTGPVPMHAIPGLETAHDGPLAHSPRVGEHSKQILKELGIDAAAVDAAITAGSVTAR
jgi:crotonobetainyl-CoA:carnitine CoA-transferase CaiB-like acyl-CoA transferase